MCRFRSIHGGLSRWAAGIGIVAWAMSRIVTIGPACAHGIKACGRGRWRIRLLARMILIGDEAGRVALVNRIVERIGIAVRPHPRQGRVEAVGREEPPHRRVVVARVETDQPGLAVRALAEVAIELSF